MFLKVLLFIALVGTLYAHQQKESYLYIDYDKKIEKLNIKLELETRIFEDKYTFLDMNHNGIISYKELRTYKEKLLSYVKTHLEIKSDKSPLSLDTAKITFHRLQDQTYMQIDKTFMPIYIKKIYVHNELFFEYEPQYKLFVTVGNDATERILDNKNRNTTITFVQETQFNRLWRFIKEGIKHILDGIDHLSFLLMLLVATMALGKSVIDLIKIITVFSIAHSLTLFIAGTGLYLPNVKFIESFIAFSILYVALLNSFKLYTHVNYGIVFVFGLVHGFGFANVLSIANIESKLAFIIALLGFNLGVEIGQIFVISLLFFPLYYISRTKYKDDIFRIISLVVAFIAAVWFVQRAF